MVHQLTAENIPIYTFPIPAWSLVPSQQLLLILFKLQGIQLLLRVVACTVVAVHAVDRPGILVRRRIISYLDQRHHLAPGLPGLLLLSGLDGRVDTGLGGSDIGLG